MGGCISSSDRKREDAVNLSAPYVASGGLTDEDLDIVEFEDGDSGVHAELLRDPFTGLVDLLVAGNREFRDIQHVTKDLHGNLVVYARLRCLQINIREGAEDTADQCIHMLEESPRAQGIELPLSKGRVAIFHRSKQDGVTYASADGTLILRDLHTMSRAQRRLFLAGKHPEEAKLHSMSFAPNGDVEKLLDSATALLHRAKVKEPIGASDAHMALRALFSQCDKDGSGRVKSKDFATRLLSPEFEEVRKLLGLPEDVLAKRGEELTFELEIKRKSVTDDRVLTWVELKAYCDKD